MKQRGSSRLRINSSDSSLCAHVVGDRRRFRVLQVVSKAVVPRIPTLSHLIYHFELARSRRSTNHRDARRRRDGSSTSYRAQAHDGGVSGTRRIDEIRRERRRKAAAVRICFTSGSRRDGAGRALGVHICGSSSTGVRIDTGFGGGTIVSTPLLAHSLSS